MYIFFCLGNLRTEEPGGLLSMVSHRAGTTEVLNTHTYMHLTIDLQNKADRNEKDKYIHNYIWRFQRSS